MVKSSFFRWDNAVMLNVLYFNKCGGIVQLHNHWWSVDMLECLLVCQKLWVVVGACSRNLVPVTNLWKLIFPNLYTIEIENLGPEFYRYIFLLLTKFVKLSDWDTICTDQFFLPIKLLYLNCYVILMDCYNINV